jgi:putative transposase
MYEWRTGSLCFYKNNVHLVFVTKYRQNALTLEMLDKLSIIFKETCEQLDCELLEFGGEDDHVHLMVSAHPKIAISNLIGKLKGKSSYMLRKIILGANQIQTMGKSLLVTKLMCCLCRRG